MMRYQIELDSSFLPEPVADEERTRVTEKAARRFDRFEQWRMRHLTDPESLYSRAAESHDADGGRVREDSRMNDGSAGYFLPLSSPALS